MLKETIKFFAPAFLFIAVLGTITEGCNCKPSKKKPQVTYNYSKGDIVYLKPDSTVASISDTRMIIEDVGRYEANYKDNSGNLQTAVIDETQIYGKKY